MTQLFTLEVETKQLKIIRSQTYLQHLSQVIRLVAKEANLRMTNSTMTLKILQRYAPLFGQANLCKATLKYLFNLGHVKPHLD